jgi:hypothetical protein
MHLTLVAELINLLNNLLVKVIMSSLLKYLVHSVCCWVAEALVELTELQFGEVVDDSVVMV